MCEATIFLYTKGTEREIMREVLTLEVGEGNRLLLTDLFGERRELEAKVKNIDFLHHKVLLEEVKTSV